MSGLHCRTIIAESKNTKTWSEKWIEKLKEDQLEVKADAAMLMTKVLPKDISNFEHKNGVWVTDYSCVIGLATALRFGILQITMTKRASEGKNEMMEFVYNYLSNQEFRQKIQAIVEAFSSMRKDLDDEKRAMTKIWAKREKQLDRVASNTVKIYGDMQGMIGATLPQIESLELEALTDGSNGDEAEDDDKEEIVIQCSKKKLLKIERNIILSILLSCLNPPHINIYNLNTFYQKYLYLTNKIYLTMNATIDMVTISSKGQIVIPKKIMKILGLKEQDKLTPIFVKWLCFVIEPWQGYPKAKFFVA